jgi:hypothetical protein
MAGTGGEAAAALIDAAAAAAICICINAMFGRELSSASGNPGNPARCGKKAFCSAAAAASFWLF